MGRRGDDEQPVLRHDRPAVIIRSGIREPLRRELGILAQRNLPLRATAVEVDGGERAPGRRVDGDAFFVPEIDIAGGDVARLAAGRQDMAADLLTVK